MMKIALLAAAAMIATPLCAQTTPAGAPPAGDPATMSAPAAGQTMTPAPGTPAQDSTMPMASTPPARSTMPTDASAPAPMASTGKLPWCRAGQFTACRERENAKGEGLRKN